METFCTLMGFLIGVTLSVAIIELKSNTEESDTFITPKLRITIENNKVDTVYIYEFK